MGPHSHWAPKQCTCLSYRCWPHISTCHQWANQNIPGFIILKAHTNLLSRTLHLFPYLLHVSDTASCTSFKRTGGAFFLQLSWCHFLILSRDSWTVIWRSYSSAIQVLDKCSTCFFFFFKLEAPSQPQHFKEFMTAVLYAELRAVAVIYPWCLLDKASMFFRIYILKSIIFWVACFVWKLLFFFVYHLLKSYFVPVLRIDEKLEKLK